MPRDNKSKRMWSNRENLPQSTKDAQLDALMWESRYNTCFETRDKLHKQLDECVDMLDRILLHVDIGYTNPSMETEIKEFLKKIR
jgi:ribosome biogenesis GTPase A